MRNEREAPSDLWTSESLGGVFTESRLRKIDQAHDVLTWPEKLVYAILWGSDPTFSKDGERIVSIGYDAAAKEAKITKRNVANIIRRLISKGFLELIAPPVVHGSRRPATYRIIGCAVVREDQKRNGREWLIRTGRGISYARKLNPKRT